MDSNEILWKSIAKLEILVYWNIGTADKSLSLLQSIKELQTSLRDGVILFRALLEELRRNMEAERDGIMATYAKVIDALKKQYELLIKDLER